jgi:hypothetical protein
MRQTFVFDAARGHLVPKEEYISRHGPNNRPGAGLLVIPDISPYQSVIDRSEIGGRRQHREHLRQHGCIEIGNEKPKPPQPNTAAPGLRESILRAYEGNK